MDINLIVAAIFGIIIGAIIGAFIGIILPILKKRHAERTSKRKIEKQDYSYRIEGELYDLKEAIKNNTPFIKKEAAIANKEELQEREKPSTDREAGKGLHPAYSKKRKKLHNKYRLQI